MVLPSFTYTFENQEERVKCRQAHTHKTKQQQENQQTKLTLE